MNELKIGDYIEIITPDKNCNLDIGEVFKIIMCWNTMGYFSFYNNDNTLVSLWYDNRRNIAQYKKYNFRKEKLKRILENE